ncbi:MAG: acetyl-CoA acetyltransferase [Planctomycetes bacterium RBG_16_64_12]|nr:MAG: acetyl-CoA acetyltransferase [Planctomycetes bacterium RBG_16_64_12]
MREAYIVSAVRTPVGKAGRGTLRTVRPDDLGALVLREAIARVPGLAPEEVEDVILGCAMPEGSQGMNVGRIAMLRAGIPYSVPAMTVNRFCVTGLETIAIAAHRVQLGVADIIVAGGTESMSQVPMGGRSPLPNAYLVENLPDAYLSMGLTAENVVRQYKISREDQDAFALESHQKAVAAIDAGRFEEEIIPVPVKLVTPGRNGRCEENELMFRVDEGPRRDTSMEALAALKPAFHATGTVTAGNSSQTSDGAAAVVVMSEDKVKQLGLKPLARFVGYAAAGVPPGIMGIGPTKAIPKLLKQLGMKLEDLDLIELNEAFAGQALAVVRECGLPRARLNVNGGAIALGHPLGATGSKLTATLLYELRRRNGRYGIVTMCVGGGMGGAGIFERV